MRVAITGSHGLIGSALVEHLLTVGHQPVRVVRGDPGPADLAWNPAAGTIDLDTLAGVDAVVNLAGEPIGVGRWTADKKHRIRESRVEGTSLLARSMASLDHGPKVLLNASAVGFYGDRGDEVLDEDSSSGDGFLAAITRDWEAATAPATDGGVRVVRLRNGIVLSADGGAMGPILRVFRLGLGGKLASGHQWWSWIAIDDVMGLLMHALDNPAVEGALNVTAPNPVTNGEFTRSLGDVLGRPTLLPAPSFGLKLVMGGERTEEMLLSSQRVLPAKALDTGFQFAHPVLGEALRSVLGKG